MKSFQIKLKRRFFTHSQLLVPLILNTLRFCELYPFPFRQALPTTAGDILVLPQRGL
jgi:hypothetical protein